MSTREWMVVGAVAVGASMLARRQGQPLLSAGTLRGQGYEVDAEEFYVAFPGEPHRDSKRAHTLWRRRQKAARLQAMEDGGVEQYRGNGSMPRFPYRLRLCRHGNGKSKTCDIFTPYIFGSEDQARRELTVIRERLRLGAPFSDLKRRYMALGETSQVSSDNVPRSAKALRCPDATLAVPHQGSSRCPGWRRENWIGVQDEQEVCTCSRSGGAGCCCHGKIGSPLFGVSG